MTPFSFKFQFATISNIPRLRTFFRTVYRQDHICTNRRHLLWQFGNPFASTKHLSARVAVNSKRVVGFLGTIPVRLWFNGSLVKAAWLANWVVHPKARGKGVGSGLLGSEQSTPLLLASSFSDLAFPMYMKRGWKEVSSYSRLLFVLNPAKVRAIAKRAYGRGATSQLKVSDFEQSHVISKGKTATIIWDDPFPSKEWDKSWKKMRDEYAVTVDRSSNYLSWRFLKHPFVTYHIGLARSASGVLVGMVVIRTESVDSFTIGRIVDLVSFGEYAASMIDEVVSFGKRQKYHVLDTYLTFGALISAFLKAGYRKDSEAPFSYVPELFNPLAVRSKDPKKRVILAKPSLTLKKTLPKADHWHIVKADGDRDRAY